MKFQQFNTALEKCATKIPYNPEWANGTGYLDHAVAFELPEGVSAKSEDPHGRRILLIGTLFGTIVIFDRHSYTQSFQVCNAPSVVTRLCDANTALDESQMHLLLSFNDNMHSLSKAYCNL